MKERLGNSFSIFSRLRIQVSHETLIAYSALAIILFVTFALRILPLRWENLTTGKILLNEFDPYYQFSITQHMVNNGILSPYWPTHWINMQKWYPWGLDMYNSLPALPMTATVLYSIVSFFGVNIDLMSFCSVLPAVIAMVSVFMMYMIGKDMGGRTVGLFAALFLSVAPSFLQRSSLGFFDTEVPGVLGLVFFTFLFLRSLDNKRSLRGCITYALGAGAALAYFISGWGAAYYVLALSVLFVFVLVLLRRYSHRMLVSYSVTFGLALFISTKVPYISNTYLFSGAVIPIAGMFVILLVAELLRNNISMRGKLTLVGAGLAVIIGGFVTLWATGILDRSGLQGKFSTVLDPFIRASSPLINSVAEQKVSAWGNTYIELGVTILFFLVGFYFTLRNPTNRNVFLLLFATTSLYFAISMVRLLVLFTPAFAIIASIGIISLLKPFFTLIQEAPNVIAKSKRRLPRVSKEYSGFAIFLIFIILITTYAVVPTGTGLKPNAISQAYSPTQIASASLPLGGTQLTQPVGAWLDAVSWLRQNVPQQDCVVMWWDYGNWLADLGNVTSFADNTTVNATQIENLGFIFMGTENQSMNMMNSYGQSRIKYIAVFEAIEVGLQNGQYVAYPGGYGDEGKWVWMARISGEAKDRLIQEGFMDRATAWVDEKSFGSSNQQNGQWQWNTQGQNTVVYKLLNTAEVTYAKTASDSGTAVTASQTGTAPTYFQQAYFSGINVAPNQYLIGRDSNGNPVGIVPVVAIYSIDWATWDAQNGITPPS